MHLKFSRGCSGLRNSVIWDLAVAERRVKHHANHSEGLLGVNAELPGKPQRNKFSFKTLPVRSQVIRDKAIT